MRTSVLVFHSLREAPQDAEAASHRLLVRGNYIRRLASGIYSFLPLGYQLLRQVIRVVEEELDAIGAAEILLPALHPAEIWEASGRLATMADVLFQVQGKAGRYVLGPTHEEVVIESLRPDLRSYRDLPAMVHQMQTKFRDEPRARFGLMRTREFIMSDGYSFDAGQDEMRASYRRFYEAYLRIFARLGLDAVPVEADSGAIGGDVNHEFMVPSPIGEDHFAHCARCGYGANIEAARAGSRGEVVAAPLDAPPPREHDTPDAPGIELAVAALRARGEELEESGMLKCLLVTDPEGAEALVLVPGDRQARLPHGFALVSDMSGFPTGYIGPQGAQERGLRVLADPLVGARGLWASGANRVGAHVVGLRLGIDFVVDQWGDFVTVADGDPCPRCGEPLSLVRSVEVGHCFQLGLSYSSKLPGATFSAQDGSEQPYWMGCYGIGVSRLPAVIAEAFGNAEGTAVAWPAEIAPYVVGVVPAGQSGEVREVADRIAGALESRGLRTLLEDRPVSTGVSLADFELIGCPVLVVVGSRSLAGGRVEVRDRRRGEAHEVPVEDAVEQALRVLTAHSSSVAPANGYTVG